VSQRGLGRVVTQTRKMAGWHVSQTGFGVQVLEAVTCCQHPLLLLLPTPTVAVANNHCLLLRAVCAASATPALPLSPPPRVAAEEDEGAGPPTSLQEDLGWEAVAPSVSDLVVPEGAALTQAGCISSMLEGMIVVTGLENSRALDMG
jgi:hypothetical protein